MVNLRYSISGSRHVKMSGSRIRRNLFVGEGEICEGITPEIKVGYLFILFFLRGLRLACNLAECPS